MDTKFENDIGKFQDAVDSTTEADDLIQARASVEEIFATWPESVNVREKTSIQAPSDSAQIEEAGDRLQSLEELKPGLWKELTEGERLQVLQRVESTMAKIQNRPEIEINAERMPANAYGYYDPNDNSIHINQSALKDQYANEAFDTITHEGRHAYQQYAVDHPGFHQDAEEVKAWEHNSKNYLDPTLYGIDVYMNQPVEKDAFNYSAAIRSAVFD